MRLRALAALLLLAQLLSGCSTPWGRASASRNVTLYVFAAASLTDAFQQIGRGFEEQHPGVRIVFNFAGSQRLEQQIEQGAGADVFASADERQMRAAVRSGRVKPGTPRVFARNRLVVIYPRSNPGRLRGLRDLARPGAKLDLAAREVPAGSYALEFLSRATRQYGTGYRTKVLGNVVSYEDDVEAVVRKVELGEADAGIVYESDVRQGDRQRLRVIEIPADLNVLARYPIATLEGSAHPGLAREFVEFVLSPDGQKALRQHGFLTAAQQQKRTREGR